VSEIEDESLVFRNWALHRAATDARAMAGAGAYDQQAGATDLGDLIHLLELLANKVLLRIRAF
jgi:hypothetical protein